MKAQMERLEPTRVKLSVEVAYEELKPAVDKVYDEVAKQVNIPGFRRGKVPRKLLDRHVGRGYVLEQAVNNELGTYYSQALVENSILPLSQPEVEVVELPNLEGAEGGELKFTAEVDAPGEFKVIDLAGQTVTVAKTEVSDDDVESELDLLRDRFASLKTVERAAAKDDFTSIDMSAEINGEVVDTVSGVSYQVGSGNMLEGMDDVLVGLSAGEEATFTSTLRGGDHAGEEASVTVKVNSVKERELPEADDDFAMMASEFDSIGDLRADLREGLAKQSVSKQGMEAIEKVRDLLVSGTEIELPAAFLDEQVEKSTPEDADEEAKAAARENVTKQAKEEIIVNQLAGEREIEVAPQDLYGALAQMAQMYGVDPTQLLQHRETVTSVMDSLRTQATLASVVKELKVVDEDGADVDLSEFLKTPSEKAAEAAAEAEANDAKKAEAEEENAE